MSAANLLARVRAADIQIEASGDRLLVDAPSGALTPELRAELARQKPALLALLSRPRGFVTLREGPTLPIEAIELTLDLERRGFTLHVVATQQIVVEPAAELSDLDRARLRRWTYHVAAVVTYGQREVEM